VKEFPGFVRRHLVDLGLAVTFCSRPRTTAGLLETNIPGIFAAGDVRSGSVKRCAAAVGEGSMAVQFVHKHLAASAVRVG
jgi:thioredoxin reductase